MDVPAGNKTLFEYSADLFLALAAYRDSGFTACEEKEHVDALFSSLLANGELWIRTPDGKSLISPGERAKRLAQRERQRRNDEYWERQRTKWSKRRRG